MGVKDSKKQIPLRVSSTLYNELQAWAEDDFRSLNGQIEFLLTEAVKKRRKKDIDEAEEYIKNIEKNIKEQNTVTL